MAAGCSPGGAEFEMALFGVNDPLDGHIPALGDTECLENARGGDLGGDVFAHNLTDDELQREPVFALFLLGDVPEQAAHGEGIAGLLALAQAELEIEDAAIGGAVTERGAVDRIPMKDAAEEVGRFAAAIGPKELLEGFKAQQGGIVVAETAFPGRIGIEEAARGAECGDHLAGILEEVAVSLLGLKQCLFLPQGRALVDGHGYQAGDRAGGVTPGGDLKRYRD